MNNVHTCAYIDEFMDIVKLYEDMECINSYFIDAKFNLTFCDIVVCG